MAALVFTAGLLTVAAVEDMIVEAHESTEDTRRYGARLRWRLRPVHAGLGRSEAANDEP